VPSFIELALFSRCRGEGNPGLSEEAKQAGPLAADPPDQTGDAELLKQLQVMFASLAWGVESVFWQGEIEEEAALGALSRRQRSHGGVELVLEPHLAVVAAGVVLEQLEGSLSEAFKVTAKAGEQAGEFAGGIKPEADVGPLFELKALQDLGDEGIKNQPGPPAVRNTPATCIGAMFTTTPSSRSGRQPCG